jgi:hypothetical protein
MGEQASETRIHTRPFLDEIFTSGATVRPLLPGESEGPRRTVAPGSLHLFAAATGTAPVRLVDEPPEPDDVPERRPRLTHITEWWTPW